MPNESLLIRCRTCRTLNRVPAEKTTEHPSCGTCGTALDYPREPVHVTGASYDDMVQNWPGSTLAEFRARWCGHCDAIEPYLKGLALRRAGSLLVIRVDVDAEQGLAARFSIRATPTFMLYRNGRQIGRFDGAPVRDQELELWIDRSLQEDPA